MAIRKAATGSVTVTQYGTGDCGLMTVGDLRAFISECDEVGVGDEIVPAAMRNGPQWATVYAFKPAQRAT